MDLGSVQVSPTVPLIVRAYGSYYGYHEVDWLYGQPGVDSGQGFTKAQGQSSKPIPPMILTDSSTERDRGDLEHRISVSAPHIAQIEAELKRCRAVPRSRPYCRIRQCTNDSGQDCFVLAPR